MLRFEWRYFTRQPSFIVTSLVFFLLPYLSVAIEEIQIGGSGNVNFNSPYSIAQTLLVMAVFGMFLVVNFVANTAIRNDEMMMSEMLYTKPIRTFSYQMGRFLGAYLVVLSVSFLVPLGLFVGSLMPWLDTERIGPINILAYIAPYLIFTVPTYLVLASLFYAAALRFKSMMAVYLFALAIFVLFTASGAIFSEPHQRDIMAISDPFGLRAFLEYTRYWTSSEKNIGVVELSGILLYNRLVWVGIGLFILFSLGNMFSPLAITLVKDKKQKTNGFYAPPLDNNIAYKYTPGADLKQFSTRVAFEMKQVILSPAFIVLVLIGAVLIVTTFLDPEGTYGADNWPLTQYMVELINSAFSLSLIIVITYYSAEVVWRERNSGMGDIIDSMPVQNFTFMFSKLLAVCLVILALLMVGMLATLANQLSLGFLDFEISQYMISLFYFSGLPWILLTILAFFIQVLSPNKYIGMLIFVGYSFVSLAFNAIGVEHNMFNYAVAPPLQYSDMNEYGWMMQTQHHYMLYWGALALVLSAFSYAMWQRGPELNLSKRFGALGYSLGPRGQTMVVLGIVGFISMGTVIYYNTRVLNEYSASGDIIDIRADYERLFSEFENAAIPSVTAVNLNVAIFPKRRKLEVIADLSFVNNTDVPIKRVLVNYPRFSTIEIKGADISDYNNRFKTAWMTFFEPLTPGESLQLQVWVTRQHRGFKDSQEDIQLVKNGTFINNFQLLPTLGVNKDIYLTDQHDRRKKSLPAPQRAYKLEDESRYNESMLGKSINMIDFKATLSTSEDQIAIAPGYLRKYWTEEERNYFIYEMDTPMLNFYSIMSGNFSVKTERYKGIDIAVYYHHEHAWNVDRMIKSTKDSIDFYSRTFGPYQHKQLRIIEFPGYAEFAQSFANTVPYSERIGFITDLRDTSEIDPVYYITAHEVAHQWFGHQLNPANVQGSQVLSESLSQYAALQVMLQEYGEVKLRRFLSYELDAYLRGRSTEYLAEMPLMRAENQTYIHYNKGSIVMMAIADRIGFTSLNKALRTLLERYKNSTSQLVTTLDLLAAIKAEAAPEHYAFIDQQFTQITIYDLRLTDAVLLEDKQSILVKIEATQYQVDGQGNESEEAFDDWVDIVVFEGDPNDFNIDAKVLYRQKHHIVSGISELVISIDNSFGNNAEQLYIGVDPFIRYIDRESKDNIRKL